MNKRTGHDRRLTVKTVRPSFRTSDGKDTCRECGQYGVIYRCSCGNWAACGECWDRRYNQCPRCSRIY
jgi:hypothetical protein